MNKQNTRLILTAVSMSIIVIIICIKWIVSKQEISELNKLIDEQEKIIQKNCWVCYSAKEELGNLYWKKSSIMSGFMETK